MIKEIESKTLLSTISDPNAWFGVRYNMNIYRGCEHRCFYCDSRSECYQIENFDDVIVKINAPVLLEKELAGKRKIGTIGTGAMSDPYTPIEAIYCLTRRILEIIARHRFPVHITTKSDLVLRDKNLLEKINEVRASVSFTLTTTDDDLARKIEPYAPSPSRRLEAMRILSESGIYVGVTMMPILPFIEDNIENITAIVEKTVEAGGHYIVPGFGVTLRGRQRSYYYRELNKQFPGLSARYMKTYGDRYICSSPREAELVEAFHGLCERYGIAGDIPQTTARMKSYSTKQVSEQGNLF